MKKYILLFSIFFYISIHPMDTKKTKKYFFPSSFFFSCCINNKNLKHSFCETCTEKLKNFFLSNNNKSHKNKSHNDYLKKNPMISPQMPKDFPELKFKPKYQKFKEEQKEDIFHDLSIFHTLKENLKKIEEAPQEEEYDSISNISFEIITDEPSIEELKFEKEELNFEKIE